MLREMAEAVAALTAQQPLVLVLEDLHWSDYSTLELLGALMRRREPARLLVIGTYRPVEVVLTQNPLKRLKQDLLVRNLCHEILMERLEESDIVAYLEALREAPKK